MQYYLYTSSAGLPFLSVKSINEFIKVSRFSPLILSIILTLLHSLIIKTAAQIFVCAAVHS